MEVQSKPNRSLNPAVYVDVQDENKTVYVKVSNAIIRAVAESAMKATVDVLDLRPVGLNLYGDSSGLNGYVFCREIQCQCLGRLRPRQVVHGESRGVTSFQVKAQSFFDIHPVPVYGLYHQQRR